MFAYVMFYRKIYLSTILALSGISVFCGNAHAADEPIELIIQKPSTQKQDSKDKSSLSASPAKNKEDKQTSQQAVRAIPLDKINEVKSTDNASTTAVQAVPFEDTKVSFLNQEVIDIDKTSIHSKYSKNDASLWNRIRAGFAMPNLENEQASEKTTWYAARPEYFSRINERASKYLYHIVEELEKRNMPLELALLPIIESAFNPVAKSSAKAAGIWQFMPKTGKYFNLEQNMFVDERRDVLSSTTAALDYLQKLHGMFGDWHLALAAYNWGEGSVSKAINRAKAQGITTPSYTAINMPNETRYYVPKLQAVKNIISDPQKYGINLFDIPNHPYFVTVTTAKDIDVDLAARLAEMPLNEFKAINPSFNKRVIIGATNPQILLPWDKAEKFQDNLKNHKWPLSTMTAITVEKKEKVEVLAQRFGVDASVIRDINNIGKGFRFRAGSTVLMPKVGNLQGDISEHIAENGKISTERDTPELKRVLVYVHKRDTLSSIADRYDVSVSQIKAWNKVGKGLKRGQRLTLVVPYNKVIHSQKPEPEEVHKPSKKLFIAKLNNKKSRNNLAENTTNNNSKFRNSKVDRHEKNRKKNDKNDKSDRIAKKEKIEVAKEDKHSKHAKLVRVAEKRQHITRN